jgi:hypothetical protein
MPNAVIDDLKSLSNKPVAFSADTLIEIEKKTAAIVSYCNEHYSDQGFYGNAALNRKILLDPFIAENLTSDVIQFLMINPSYVKQKVTRKTIGSDQLELTLRDIILHGFADGLLAIKMLPNNEVDYGKEGTRCATRPDLGITVRCVYINALIILFFKTGFLSSSSKLYLSPRISALINFPASVTNDLKCSFAPSLYPA